MANASHYPAFRTSGVSLSLEISYTNANDQKLAELNRKSVGATVKASVQTGAFSSVGGSTTFSTYPSGDIGAETWDLTSRYKQGITVHLTSSGVIYSFDPFYFVNVMVAGLVLLGLASTVADFFAFWCLGGGQSTVLRNKQCEKVSKRSEFAETGLKAVIAAQQFKLLDPDGNGAVEAVDLVKALAGVESAETKEGSSQPFITHAQAHAIATAIMRDADDDKNSKSAGSLDFAEFMTCLDGDGGSFQFFLDKLKIQERDVYLLVLVHSFTLTYSLTFIDRLTVLTFFILAHSLTCSTDSHLLTRDARWRRRISPTNTSKTAKRPSTRHASRPRPQPPPSGSPSPCATRTWLWTWLLRCRGRWLLKWSARRRGSASIGSWRRGAYRSIRGCSWRRGARSQRRKAQAHRCPSLEQRNPRRACTACPYVLCLRGVGVLTQFL